MRRLHRACTVIELYSYPSYISLLPHILLHEIGIEHRLELVDRYALVHKREVYPKLNPNGLIPVLKDRDLVLYEAAAIALHLADKHPESRLAPAAGTDDRAHFHKWLMWLPTGLHPALSNDLHPGKWTADEAAQAALRHVLPSSSISLTPRWRGTHDLGCSARTIRSSMRTPSRCVAGPDAWRVPA
jgi:glutathione S-transferase